METAETSNGSVCAVAVLVVVVVVEVAVVVVVVVVQPLKHWRQVVGWGAEVPKG